MIGQLAYYELGYNFSWPLFAFKPCAHDKPVVNVDTVLAVLVVAGKHDQHFTGPSNTQDDLSAASVLMMIFSTRAWVALMRCRKASTEGSTLFMIQMSCACF